MEWKFKMQNRNAVTLDKVADDSKRQRVLHAQIAAASRWGQSDRVPALRHELARQRLEATIKAALAELAALEELAGQASADPTNLMQRITNSFVTKRGWMVLRAQTPDGRFAYEVVRFPDDLSQTVKVIGSKAHLASFSWYPVLFASAQRAHDAIPELGMSLIWEAA